MNNQMEQEKLYARHGRATDAIAAINPNNRSKMEVRDPADKAIFRQDGIEVAIVNYSKMQSSLGVNIHKLLTYGIIKFTRSFNGPPPENIYEVQFSIDEYIRITGGNLPADRKRRRRKRNEMAKRLRRELMLLQAIRLTSTYKNDFESINIVNRTAVKNGIVTIEFFRSFAEYLLHQPKTIIHPMLLQIDARSTTAYAIGLKCTEYSLINNNRKTSAGHHLRVKSILKSAPLPDYEQVLTEGRSWKHRIMRPFEKAMNELVSAGVLHSWKYETPINGSSYHTFEEAMICFEVADQGQKRRVVSGGL